MAEILSSINWSPLWISLKTALVATVVSFFLGLYIARFVMYRSQKTKWILDGVFTLPLVLPPTVAGFLLLLLFSLRRPIGMFLDTTFDFRFVQTWAGCVLAATVIAFPLMYRNARSAFEQVDITMIYAARTLGLSERKTFWHVILPIAAPGVASGTVLAFARALGEYGATVMLAGNILGKTRTVSTAIAAETAAGNYTVAGFWVIVIICLSFLIIVAINAITGRGMRQIRRWK